MSDEMVTRVGYDSLARVLNRLGDMLTEAGLYPEMPHEEAVGALIAERDRLREALREVASWRCQHIDRGQADDCEGMLMTGTIIGRCYSCRAREALGEVKG